MSGVAWEVHVGDCRDVLRALPERSVHTVVTSPPYFGLRDYGTGAWEGGDPGCDHVKGEMRRGLGLAEYGRVHGMGGGHKAGQVENIAFGQECGKCGATRVDQQIGLEPTPDDFVAALVGVFREVRRVLRDDGTVWLNLGDSYAGGGGHSPDAPSNVKRREMTANGQRSDGALVISPTAHLRHKQGGAKPSAGKPKDLIGIPWMVAFALRADGWYLRSDIIWHKPNPMPESVTDRPTKAHEYVFLLSKGPRYYYDADAIREDDSGQDHARVVLDGQASLEPSNGLRGAHNGIRTAEGRNGAGRNKRSVWTVASQPYAGAHFATFPPKLIEPCILAGCPEQCCSECGAPWERVVEREANPAGIAGGEHREVKRDGGIANGRPRDYEAEARIGSRRTLGFESSCSCGLPAAPGVVLDPFAGAGTTGVVALRRDRSFVGIELNAEYADLARERIRGDAPLFNTMSEVGS